MRIPIDIPFSREEAARITEGVWIGPQRPFPSFLTTRSTEVEPGDLFCALQGEKADGNHFITEAAMRGAGMILAQKVPPFPPPCALLVKDTHRALGALAHAKALRPGLRTVAITGSVGKTTVKEAIATVLAQRYAVHKTPGNFNNRLGLPLSLLTMPSGTEIAVLELGTGAPGELLPLAELLRPEVAVITRLGTAHIGNFGSRLAIAKEKMTVAAHLEESGMFLLPQEFGALPLKLPHPGCFFSLTPGEGAFSVEILKKETKRTNIRIYEETLPKTSLWVNGFGEAAATVGLLTYAVCRHFSLEEEAIQGGLACFQPPAGRGRTERLGEVFLSDDGYNASPEAMEAALERLAFLAPPEKRRAFSGICWSLVTRQKGSTIAVSGSGMKTMSLFSTTA